MEGGKIPFQEVFTGIPHNTHIFISQYLVISMNLAINIRNAQEHSLLAEW